MDANERTGAKTNDSVEEEEGMETEENGGNADNEVKNDNNFSIQTVSNENEVGFLVENSLSTVGTLIIQVDPPVVAGYSGDDAKTVLKGETKPNILVDCPRIKTRTSSEVQDYIVLVEDGFNEELELEDEDGMDEDEEDEKKKFKLRDLNDVKQFLHKNSQFLVQVLQSECMGEFIKVSPSLPNPVLVDEPVVKLNIYSLNARLYCEVYSFSRKCLRRVRLVRTETLNSCLEDLLQRYQCCQGTPREYDNELRKRIGKSDFKHIYIAEYNNNIIMRSNKCRYVVDREIDKENFYSKILRCQSCQKLTNHLLQKYIIKEIINKHVKDEMNEHYNLPDVASFPAVDNLVKLEENQENQDQLLPPGLGLSDHQVQTADLETRNPPTTGEEIYQLIDQSIPSKPSTKSKVYVCTRTGGCGERFDNASSLREHNAMHKTERKEKVGNTSTRKSISGVQLKDGGLIQDGAKNQDGGKPAKKRNGYNCDDCGMQFNALGALKIHSTIHSGVKDWLCTDCGKSYHSQSSLIDHQKRIHLGQLNYPCEVCDKPFYSISERTTHMRCHTGDKPFQCDICDRLFRRVYHLNRHMKRVHQTGKNGISESQKKKKKNTDGIGLNEGEIKLLKLIKPGGQEGDDLWVEVTADQNSVSTANRHPLAEFSSKPLIVQKSPPEVSSASIKSTVPISGVKIQVPQLPAAAELSVREFFQSEQIAFNQRLAARSLKKDK